ncbi:MAG TPA: tRNA(His) guanylyltransferase Thg1 family protein [Saprospiraceae bacterium]|nr:tRNA(His) guanylyltransferase Thg1 family protein [Saprospiraceae bacterium]HMQ82847.1 tRNA(His) guanylyltransferase Thg1 family protein [Saprospiraceae bacterium]
MDFQTMGDWCKWLERNFTNEIMIPTLPVIIRLDGNNFHNWTKGLRRPFDEKLTALMIETTKFLVQETNAVAGYTQSDEITLILYSADREKLIYNDGKKQKILSKLTGKCVSFFNEKRKELLPAHDKIANFDCRIYQTPTLHDACVQLLWRENDATKNSISMLAQSLFSHKALQNLNGSEMQDKMMLEKGVNWNDLDVKYKRGTYIKRIKYSKPFTAEELALLPPKHHAHRNPDIIIERYVIQEMEYPIFNKITNKEAVIFFDAEPLTGADS